MPNNKPIDKIPTSWAFRIWWRDMKMNAEMFLAISAVIAFVQVFVFIAAVRLLLGSYDFWSLIDYMKAVIFDKIWPAYVIDVHANGHIHPIEASKAAPIIGDHVRPLFWKIHIAALCSIVAWGLWPVVIGYFERIKKQKSEAKYIAGAKFVTVEEIRKEVKKAGGGNIGIGPDVVMPRSIETSNTLTIGSSGSGKTTLLTQVIDSIYRNEGKAIVYDYKGDYISQFYNPANGDIIFNPLDKRHCGPHGGWSISNEAGTIMDHDAIAQSLIPQAKNDDAFWSNAARGVFSGALAVQNLRGDKTNKGLWEFLHQDGKMIMELLREYGQPGWRYIMDASSKQALSVFATLEQFILPIRYMQESDGSFNFGRWLADERPGILFISNYEDIKDTLRPVLSLAVDLLARKLLTMSESDKRRVYFILDELGSLQRLPSLIDLLTRARSKGGASFLGIQDFGQLDHIYTREHRQSIVNTCSSSIIMSVKDPDTAAVASKMIGETEIEEPEITDSVGPLDSREGGSTHRRKQRKELVMASSITHELEKYHFYLTLSGMQVLKTQTKVLKLPSIAQPFVMRPELSLEYIKQQFSKADAAAKVLVEAAEAERAEIAKDKEAMATCITDDLAALVNKELEAAQDGRNGDSSE
jgi:type IV secretory pathway TraG/TraD family ATPase VirD4